MNFEINTFDEYHPYRVYFPSERTMTDNNQHILDWCFATYGDDYWRWTWIGYSIWFKFEKDYIWFVLRWS